jgi:NADH dehydrogenase
MADGTGAALSYAEAMVSKRSTSGPDSKKPHVVVLGAGFAGLDFCRNFPGGLARITVVDRQNHHLFQPLLYQVATAGLSAADIAQPIRGILRDRDDVAVRMAGVTGVDLAGGRVRLSDGAELAFDYLVVALGSRTIYFGHPEWAEFAPGLKTLDDAVRIRRQLLLAFERAEKESDPARRDELMTVAIIGGGPTGVELAGTIAELARRVLIEDFAFIDSAQTRVVLIEGGEHVLDTYPLELRESARRQLEKLGAEVITGRRASDIRRGEVVLGDLTIRAGTILWAAGVGASSVTRSLGVPLDRGGRVLVKPDLSLPGHPRAFACGDLAAVPGENGGFVPGVAPAAMQMGRHLARVIADDIRAARHGQTGARPAFVYKDKGSLAAIGRAAAVAQVGRLRFSGRAAWFAWLTVHLFFLVGFRNRLSVFASWVHSYFTAKKRARIILGVEVEEAEAK